MTPGELQRSAFDFRLARAVSCAVELGVFEALGRDTRSAEQVAESCGLDLRGARILLGALTSAGVLEREAADYRIPASLRGSLLEGEPDYLGNLWLHDLWHWTSWARLDTAVREGTAVEDRTGDPHLANPDILRRFLPNYVAAMDQCTGDAPDRLAERLAPLGPRAVLDLGAGAGANLVSLLERLPDSSGTLGDLEFAMDAAKQRMRESGLDGRVETRVVDFERDPIPEGHDLILLSRVLMGLPADRARKLVERCAEALLPGGWLAVHDYDGATRVGALLSLDMLLNTGGQVHAMPEVESWLTGCGLEPVLAESLTAYSTLCLYGKPEAA